MLKTQDYQELFQLGPEIAKTLDIYRRTQIIFSQARLALGQVPSLRFSYSITKEGKVNYGRNYSTKIYKSE
jgi:hypothetical protein